MSMGNHHVLNVQWFSYVTQLPQFGNIFLSEKKGPGVLCLIEGVPLKYEIITIRGVPLIIKPWLMNLGLTLS